MSADSPRRSSGSRGPVPAIVPPQVVSDRSILDSAIGFINDVTLAHQPHTDPKDTITWARFEHAADISDPRFGEDWELEGNVAPPLLLILGYGLGVQMWAIPANGEAVEVLSWRHGIVSALRVLPTPASAVAIDENGRADEPVDVYSENRPLIAMVDGSTPTGAQPQFCAVNFVSLKTNTQVKTIKFKNPVLDILANRSSIVITFHERIAVFDARTLEDRLSITTCFPSPGINPNPVALGPRWLAYAEHKLMHTKRSGGGCDGEGVASYTATVLNVAKSFGKGLRELGEQVAAGLTGTTGSISNSKNNSFDSVSGGDAKQPGIVTIMDIKHPIKDYSPTSGTPMTGYAGSDPIVAHFIAHSEAVVALEFDNTGMLLLTADRRGHDFHIFRIQPHPVGSSLAAVHHLYVLHRGDTSAKVQNITFSLDSRWAAVSTLRGTTHVFPITPYGGPMGVRTHSSLHVVNKLSRFHRSAGLTADGRSSSPISHSESTTFMQSLQPYHNPTLSPFPRPSVVLPLAQLRQPFALGSPPGSATLAAGGKSSAGGGASGSSQRQRLSSLSDDNGKPLSVCGIFAKSRSWLLEPPNTTREASHRIQRKAVDSLFVMAGHGALIQYDLDTKLASNVAKEKICDDTPIELEVEAKAQWNLGRRKDGSQEIRPPLSLDNWLIKDRNSCMLTDSTRHFEDADDRGESWLSQVEIITHAGPHRRLWMGPQFVFKTYNTPSGSNLNHVDVEAVEIGVSKPTTAAAAAAATRVERSSPLNMPLSATARSSVPVLIESGSYSSIEQSPKLMDRFRHEHLDSDFAVAHGDSRLKEDLADAMRESPSVSAAHKDAGRVPSDAASSDNVPFYDALAEHEHDDDDQAYDSTRFSSASAAALASALPHISSYDRSSSYESLDSLKRPKTSIEKVVNPLGTVTTVTAAMSSDQTDILDEVVSQLAAEDCVIHENCDESLFRPVVAIFCDENTRKMGEEEARKSRELCKPPEIVGNKLIVPVIAKEVDAELSKKEKLKSDAKTKLQKREKENYLEEQRKFAEFSYLNKKSNTKMDKESVEVFKEVVEKRDFGIGEQQDVEAGGEKELKAMDREFFVEVKEQVKTVKKSSRKELIVEEKPTGRITAKAEDKSRSTSKANEKTRKSEEREMKLKNILEERKEVEGEVGGRQANAKDPVKKESSRKDSTEEEKPLEFIRMTPMPADKTSKQTAENATSSAKEKTAAAENHSISKATIKPKTAETKTATKSDPRADIKGKELSTKVAKNKVKDEGPVLITEELNVSDLTDSLVEAKCDDSEEKEKDKLHEEMKKCKNLDKSGKVKEKPLKSVELLEPVEIYPHPTSSKKIKQKANKTESNLEIEEIIEANSERRSSDFTEEEQPQMEKKSSISSEDSNTDLADSLLENKANIGDTMYVSFTQMEQQKIASSSDDKPIKKFAVTEFQKTKKGDKIVKKSPEDTIIAITTTDEFVGELKKGHKKVIKAAVNTTPEEKQKSQESEEEAEVALEKVDDVKNEWLLSKKTDDIEKDLVKKSKKESKENVVETKRENDNTIKDKELKGDMKKESYKKEFTKTAEERTADCDEIKRDTEAIKNVIKSMDIKTKSASKTELASVTAPSSPKHKVAEVLKYEMEVMPPPVSPLSIAEDRKAKKTTVNSKLEDIKVITEQPTKSKKIKSAEDQTSMVKEDKKETLNAENVFEVTKREKKNLKVEAPKPDSTKDGAAITVKSVKSKAPTKDMELALTTLKTKEVSAPPAAMSAWKMLSGSEMINKNLESLTTHTAEDNHSSLGKVTKNKTSKSGESKVVNQTTETTGKLLDLPTPLKSPPDLKASVLNPVQSKNNKKSKKAPPAGFDDFPLLKPLEALPPLPDLEPLEVFSGALSKTKDTTDDQDVHPVLSEQVSLINFESPLQENPALERKITPPPRGFTEQNLIFALCGSLHYENESPKVDVSPTLSLTRSSSAMGGEQSTADYKSLTENDDQYMSLEQSSQDTNTTNTATTNEKVSSSPNSSASEEILVLNDKKLTKKQRRKKQQMELEKQREKVATDEADVDEELRPLISMTDSHFEHYIGETATSEHFAAAPLPMPPRNTTTTPNLMDESFSLKGPVSSSLLGHSTTTDSEGPMPATTSDDNVVFTLPSASTSTATLNKLKTKKLEHKINLIAAIEAATSSSTSSAEESGVEGGGRSPSELDGSALVSVAATATHHPLPPTSSGSAQQSAAKKKTKRRKR